MEVDLAEEFSFCFVSVFVVVVVVVVVVVGGGGSVGGSGGDGGSPASAVIVGSAVFETARAELGIVWIWDTFCS